MLIASLTPIVLKRMPSMPALTTPCFTCSESSSRCMLHGFPSNQVLAMPTCALARSASVIPVAKSMARDPTCERTCVRREEWRLISDTEPWDEGRA